MTIHPRKLTGSNLTLAYIVVGGHSPRLLGNSNGIADACQDYPVIPIAEDQYEKLPEQKEWFPQFKAENMCVIACKGQYSQFKE